MTDTPLPTLFSRIRTGLLSMIMASMFCTCTGDHKKAPVVSIRDSIMRDYFVMLDSFSPRDIEREEYTLLEAYYKNDTAYLQKSYASLADNLKIWRTYFDSTACESPPPIDLLNYHEVYRFSYWEAFCDTSIVLTISRRSSEIFMDVILHERSFKDGKCRIVRQFKKDLATGDWEKLRKDLDFADFWGLQVTKVGDRDILDGSSLHVYGYERSPGNEPGRYKGIYRRCPEEMAIGVLFKEMLDLSGIKVRCFHYDRLRNNISKK